VERRQIGGRYFDLLVAAQHLGRFRGIAVDQYAALFDPALKPRAAIGRELGLQVMVEALAGAGGKREGHAIYNVKLDQVNLNGQAALITGGGSGLGAATAMRLSEAGAKVTVLDVNFEGAQTVAARCGGLALQCDVSDPASATGAIAQAREKHGAARILVNCAGIGLAKRIVGKEGPMPLEDFTRVIQVNLIGTFNMMRLAAADMTTLDPLVDGERGVIVSTASIAAYEGQIGQAAYSASKGGIVALTMPAARELAQFGIRVLAIAPGLFLTPLLQKLPAEVQTSLGATIPFPKRLGGPPEFAELVLHCVQNVYLNGEVIRLDGSLRMAAK